MVTSGLYANRGGWRKPPSGRREAATDVRCVTVANAPSAPRAEPVAWPGPQEKEQPDGSRRSVHVVHAAARRHRRALLLLGDLGHERIGGEQPAGDRAG